MRRILVIAVAVAAFALAAIPAGASRAHSEGCTPPHVNGFTFSSLNQSGIGCDHARDHAVQTMRHGTPHGWSCTHRISGRNVSFSCHSQAHSSHTYSFSYHVH